MRYIKNDLFTAFTGQPFKIADPELDMVEHEATIGEVLTQSLKFYDLNHVLFAIRENPPKALSPKETGHFNNVMDILGGEPQEQGHYRLETEEYETMRKVLGWTLPMVPWWRNQPLINTLLSGAPEKLPAAVSAPTAEAPEVSPAETSPDGARPSVAAGG